MVAEQLVVGLATNAIYDILKNFWNVASSAQVQHRLKNVEITSAYILRNSDLPENIKAQVRSARLRIREEIRAAAGKIEEGGLEFVKHSVSQRRLAPRAQGQAENLIDGQYRLRVSYKSVQVALRIFCELNEGLLAEIERLKEGGDTDALMDALLMNAILVAELSDVIMELLKNFDRTGLDLIRRCYEEVMGDLEKNEKYDKRQEEFLDSGKVSKGVVVAERESLELRRRFRKKIKRLWKQHLEGVNAAGGKHGVIKQKIRDLRAIRNGARSQLSFLEFAAITGMINKSIRAVQGLIDISDVRLAQLADKDVYLLLGLEEGEAAPRVVEGPSGGEVHSE